MKGAIASIAAGALRRAGLTARGASQVASDPERVSVKLKGGADLHIRCAS